MRIFRFLRTGISKESHIIYDSANDLLKAQKSIIDRAERLPNGVERSNLIELAELIDEAARKIIKAGLKHTDMYTKV